MFSFAILAVVVGIVVLFAHNWGVDTGPGIITKIKIFITHCQVGCTGLHACHTWICSTAPVACPGGACLSMRAQFISSCLAGLRLHGCNLACHSFCSLHIQ